MSSFDEERRRAERAQLGRDLASLERQWRAMPWLSLSLLACIPTGWFWGKTGVIVTILIVAYVIGVSIYITQGNLHRVRQTVDEFDAREKRRGHAAGDER